jgi:tryptophan-rich hypothetical protein
MNKINPEKLLLSKWTALKPIQKERHFIVTKLHRNGNETIISCDLEAVINKHRYQIDWQELKDCAYWQMGWK